jgi:hypothetical protein
MKTNWHHYMQKLNWDVTFGSHMNEHQSWKPINLFFFEKPDKFFHKTSI